MEEHEDEVIAHSYSVQRPSFHCPPNTSGSLPGNLCLEHNFEKVNISLTDCITAFQYRSLKAKF